MLDWLIARPDGTEGGNYVGKAMDTFRATGRLPHPDSLHP